MTIAELHGKLSSSGNFDDRVEDLLTSDVFGALRYLPPDRGIVPFLNAVLHMNSVTSVLRHPDRAISPSQVRYHFWPWGTVLRREPDLLVLLDLKDEQYAFVFEAKYRSGPSDLEPAEDLGANEPTELGEAPAAYGLQLADQYDDLIQPSPYREIAVGAPIKNRFLIYITAHTTCPRETLDRSLDQLNKRHEAHGFQLSREFAAGHMLWASWFDVWRVIKEQDFRDFPFGLVAQDLLRLLARKGFRAFSGFADITDQPRLGLPASGAFWREVWFHREDETLDLGAADLIETSGAFWRDERLLGR